MMIKATSTIAVLLLGVLVCRPGWAGGTESGSGRFRSPERPDDRREAFDLWALAAPDGRLRISPMRQWSRTGLALRKGQQLEIAGEGKVQGCQGPVGWWAYGPFGPSGGPSDIDPDSRVCALIGRIVGEGEPREFIVGEKLQLDVPFDGRLDLGVSDVWHFDNSGEFLVAVTVDGKPVDFVRLQGPSPVPVPERLSPKTPAPAGSSSPQAAPATSAGDRQTSANRDHLVGWYKLERGDSRFDTVIPVFKADGTYYSVGMRGVEVPMKECQEGLEWGINPSSMTGTRIACDKASGACSILIVDEEARRMDARDTTDPPKWQPMTRIDRPAGLHEPDAPRPAANDDFVGWYQWAWFPPFRFEVRKNEEKYAATMQSCRKDAWEAEGNPCELTPLPKGCGFSLIVEGMKLRLVYNESRKRYELTKEDDRQGSPVMRIPVARIPAPPSPEGGALPPMLRIGIPSWH